MDSYVLFSILLVAAMFRSVAATRSPGRDFIVSSCKVTRYPDVCVASLSSYAGSVQGKHSQRELVKVAVKVSLLNARNLTAWAVALAKRSKGLNRRERAALKDCKENFGDTLEQIRQSLAELKHLRRGTFKFQMSNVETWMSAALTNYDSCLDGFQAVRTGRIKMLVNGRVQNGSKLVSNALALVNRLATRAGY